MLQEERFMEIVKLVDSKKSVTVQELMDFYKPQSLLSEEI